MSRRLRHTVQIRFLELWWLVYRGWFKHAFESIGFFSDSSRKNIYNEIFLFYHGNVCCMYSLESSYWGDSKKCTQHIIISKTIKKTSKSSSFASWPVAMINPHWRELPMSRLNFHSPKEQRIRIFYWWHINRHSFTRDNDCEDYSRSHKWCDSSDRVHKTFSKGCYRCRECIPIANGVLEETVLVNISSSMKWNAIGCWFLLPLFWGWRSLQGILALPFRPLKIKVSLLPLRLLWRDSHPNYSRMLVTNYSRMVVILPVSINVKKTAFWNKEHTTNKKMGVSVLLKFATLLMPSNVYMSRTQFSNIP